MINEDEAVPVPDFFRVDRTTGGLHFTGQYTPVGNPSSIIFLDLAKAG